MPIVITQENQPEPPGHPRQYALYNGLILNWQVRAIEELAHQLGTYEDEIVMSALSLFLALHSDRMNLRSETLFDQEAPGKIVRIVRTLNNLREGEKTNE